MSRQTGLGTLEAEAAAISGHLFLPARIQLVTSGCVVPQLCPLDISLFFFFFFFFSIWLFAGICSAGPHNVFPLHVQIDDTFQLSASLFLVIFTPHSYLSSHMQLQRLIKDVFKCQMSNSVSVCSALTSLSSPALLFSVILYLYPSRVSDFFCGICCQFLP